MIKDIWSLKLDGKILGVRVLTEKGQYYDIDIDVYKKMKLDPRNLKSLPLIECGDMLMTEEEFNSGLIIEDGSNNKQLLEGVKSFVNKVKMTDPKELAKRKKKKFEYRQSYYTYLPNKWLDEFAEYHLDNFEGNNNIYSSLNGEQLTLVKDYFRWRSRLIFYEYNAPKVLRTKPKKSEKLLELMGDANDWQYDGTVDTGYLGGGVCELGHPLRYEHYAYSPSLNRHIIFGVTCVSDFFELDEAVVKNIMKAQETLLKELKAIVFILNTGKLAEYKEDYKDLWAVLRYFKGQFNDIFKNGSGWSRFMGGFEKAGLPLTRSMVMKYRELLKLYNEEKMSKEVNSRIDAVLADVEKLPFNRKVVEYVLADKSDLKIAAILRLLLLNGEYNSLFVKEGLNLLPSLVTAKMKLSDALDNKYKFETMLKENFYFITVNGRRRLATMKEIKYQAPNVVKEPFLGVERTKQMLVLIKYLDKYDRYEFSKTSLDIPEFVREYEVNFIKDLGYLVEALDFVTSGEADKQLSVLLKEVKSKGNVGWVKHFNVIVQPETAEDEVINTESLHYRYDFIEENLEKLSPSDKIKYANIRSRYNNFRGDEQLINSLYYKLINQVQSNDKANTTVNTVTPLDDELEAKLAKIEKALEAGKLSPNNFVFKVIPTIRKTGRMTEKQKKFVDDALKYVE